MKKNLFLMALAAIAMLATSCQKENDNGAEAVADTRLRVRIANVGVKSRAVGDPATDNQITLTNGIVFVLNAGGNVTYKESINTTAIIGSSGQVLAEQVAKTDKVYIVANLTQELITKLTDASNLTLDKINDELLDITSTVGQDYKKVTLANSNAQSAAISVVQGASTASVSVNIAPVYSRIELAKVTGAPTSDQTLASFNVTGVYVTDYYLQYTLGGSFGGAIYKQQQSADFSLVNAAMKDEGTWSSTSATGSVSATAGDSKSWVYNVPADALPRLIVKLAKVEGTKDGSEIENKNPYYLTLTGYSQQSTPITRMVRGKIYRIENLNFNLDQMATKPNEDQVNLTVKVAIEDWVIEAVDGNL